MSWNVYIAFTMLIHNIDSAETHTYYNNNKNNKGIIQTASLKKQPWKVSNSYKEGRDHKNEKKKSHFGRYQDHRP